MFRVLVALLCFSVMTSAHAQPTPPATAIQRSPTGVRPGRVAWVRVADAPLVFTGQVTATDVGGDARTQAEGALRVLAGQLGRSGSDRSRIVRLSAYVASDADIPAVESVIDQQFAGQSTACSVVRTPLAAPGARVAFEAVAMSSTIEEKVLSTGDTAILPTGGKIFVSGQAEKGPDLAASVRQTMAGLQKSLVHLGLMSADVVQVKAFVRPFADHAAATNEIAASFIGGAVPPIVLIEWQSDLFAEIEFVASARALPAPAGGTLEYIWLPWLPKSPRYSSACRVAAGAPLIFIGALEGGAGEARVQVKTTFERLGSVLFDAGGSFRTLVKATYYLGDPAARATLGDIRDVYFDPLRPPAASALNIASLGNPGRALMLDLIAVPVK